MIHHIYQLKHTACVMISVCVKINRVKRFTQLIFFILGCELVGFLATPFTLSAIPTWYVGLNKPFFSPPNWVFGPVWTTLYFLMGISAYLIWQEGYKKKKVRTALRLFTIQLTLNFLWSLFFFGLHSTILGLLDIGALLYYIILSITAFYKLSKTAANLLLPYLLWVSFASLLNIAIVLLNS